MHKDMYTVHEAVETDIADLGLLHALLMGADRMLTPSWSQTRKPDLAHEAKQKVWQSYVEER